MISFTIPLKTKNTLNVREHWAVRAKRAANQKRAVRLLCPAWTSGPLLVVKLTRVSPRSMDSDGVVAALKSVRDGIATWLRIDDASPLVRWEYEQERGEPCVKVEVSDTGISAQAGRATTAVIT